MTEHAKLSPSSSARWMTCPGSMTLIDTLSELLDTSDVASDPALKGTALHEVAEKLLLKQALTKDDFMWTDSNFKKMALTVDDIADCVTPYIEYADSLNGDRHVELKVRMADDCWGTADLVMFDDGTLVVCDLKTGYGKVDAKDNTQLLLYALGALKSDFAMMYNIKHVEVVVSQGRINHHDSHTYSVDDIWLFDERLAEAIDDIHIKTDKYVTSDKGCQWCPARAHCPAIKAQVHAAAQDDFKAMTLDALGDALGEVPLMKAWIKGVEDQVKEHLEKGDQVTGYKMVEGRKSRKWIDETAAEAYFKNRVNRFQHNCYNMKFKSPAQMEKTLKLEDVKVRGKVDFDKVVVKAGGAPTVVPEADKRDALVYGDRAASDFANCDEDLLD